MLANILPALPITCVASVALRLTDHRLHPRGNQEEQHLRADDDRTHLAQCNELCGVEQEGGAGHRTSHQTFKGDTSVIMVGIGVGSVAVVTSRPERERGGLVE